MKRRRDTKLLPLYLNELPKNETPDEIFNVHSIFKLWVEIEKFSQQKKPHNAIVVNNFSRYHELPHKSRNV